jgi:hypothetical protein
MVKNVPGGFCNLPFFLHNGVEQSPDLHGVVPALLHPGAMICFIEQKIVLLLPKVTDEVLT